MPPAPARRSSRGSDGATSSARELGWRADGMRHRDDAAGVDLLHLLGIREEVGELAAEQRGLVGRQREACEPRQPVDVSG